MVVDLTLTTEEALRRIGNLEEILNYGFQGSNRHHMARCYRDRFPSLEISPTSWEDPYWHMRWDFAPGSRLHQVMLDFSERRTTAPIGTNVGELVTRYLSSDGNLLRILGSYIRSTENRNPPFLLSYKVETPTSGIVEEATLPFADIRYEKNRDSIDFLVYEAVINAFEHGANFEGPVSFTFVGGLDGCAIFVDDPGEGFDLHQLTFAEAFEIRKRVGFTYPHHKQPTTFEELDTFAHSSVYNLDRGRGLGCFNFSVNPLVEVGIERIDTGSRLILVYGKPYGDRDSLFPRLPLVDTSARAGLTSKRFYEEWGK